LNLFPTLIVTIGGWNYARFGKDKSPVLIGVWADFVQLGDLTRF
jgi:hypothetical protein